MRFGLLKTAETATSAISSKGTDIFEKAGIDPGYLILGLLVVEILLLVLFLILFIQHIRIRKNYKSFMQGAAGNDLEKSILLKFKEFDKLRKEFDQLKADTDADHAALQLTYQKMGMVKYDAFKEMGGRLSFSLCMLDNNDNGYLITSMHTREGCYTYVKEIIRGESYVVLAEEEKQALEQAKARLGSESSAE